MTHKAWQHTGGTIAGTPYAVGSWLVRVQWFERINEDENRGMLYKRLSNRFQDLAVRGLLRVGFNAAEVTLSFKTGQGWWLEQGLHDKILRLGRFE